MLKEGSGTNSSHMKMINSRGSSTKMAASLCCCWRRRKQWVGMMILSMLSLLVAKFSSVSAFETTDNTEFPSRKLIDEILQVPGPFFDEKEENDCKRMVETLSAEEIEQAARTSYAYWVKVVVYDDCPSEEVKVRMAMREARRHYVGHGNIFEIALNYFRDTLKWRKEHRIDLLRAVCIRNIEDFKNFTDEDKMTIKKFREWIEHDLNKQTVAVRGHDRFNRSIAIKHARAVPTTVHDLDSFRTTQLFITEKAIAVTEIRTLGREEKQMSIFDFSNYNPSNAPPLHVGKTVLRLVQAHYPERSCKMIIADVPFWMRVLRNIAEPLLSQANKGKLFMLSNVHHKKEILEPLIDAKQAMPFMLPDGELASSIDEQKILNQPFHFLYDER